MNTPTENQFHLMLTSGITTAEIKQTIEQLNIAIQKQTEFLNLLLKTPESNRTPTQNKFINSTKTSIAIFTQLQNQYTAMVAFHFGSGYVDMLNIINLQKETIQVLKEENRHLRAGGQHKMQQVIENYVDFNITYRTGMLRLKLLQNELLKQKKPL